MSDLRTLDDCRTRIDALDAELVRLLSERARVSLRVGELKAGKQAPIYVPDREARVFENLEKRNTGPLPDLALRHIWTEILSSSRALQRRLRVAFLEPIGTFSYEAARRRFGASTEFVPCRTIPEVFYATARGDADYGIVPIENSTDGGVSFTLDTFVEMDIKVCAEIEIQISANLCSHGTLESVDTVYSQPVALAQCRRWLSANLPRAEIIEVTSTARAIELAKEPNEAGIGSESAAEVFGVPILARGIEDQRNNFTRFVVIGDHVAPPTGRDKSAIVFGVRHHAGALHEALRIFAARGVNLTRIESRPSKRRIWEYVFFVDFQGHQDDPAVRQALAELGEHAQFIKVLGSWPDESRPNEVPAREISAKSD
ncbi:MAG: prephenate dehydratase [Chloroflexota bacterium]|nr:MAG: prephenate dehydratase [Chloroflexota bacterium]